MLNMFSLRGKRALVTGGNSGIGQAMAAALAQAGAAVTIVGRDVVKVETAVAQINAAGGTCSGFATNLTTESVEKVVQKAGAVDILVNAAGVNLRQPVDEIQEADWDTTHDINLKVPFFLSRIVATQMMAQGWGRIINVASLQSQRAFEQGLAYGASKGGVAQLTRAMAETWSGKGVNANAIAPGFFNTPLTQKLFDDPVRVKAMAGKTAVGRNGKLEDLHGITIFLASPASDYITGQIIYVDGGFTAK